MREEDVYLDAPPPPPPFVQALRCVSRSFARTPTLGALYCLFKWLWDAVRAQTTSEMTHGGSSFAQLVASMQRDWLEIR